MGALNNVAVQWLIRRVPDWGGWIGTIVMAVLGIYNAFTPAQQEVINQVFSGNWQGITLGALVPFIAVIYSQIISFRKTTQQQVVMNVDGKTVSTPLKDAPVAAETVKAVTPKPARKSLVDILQGK